MKFVIASDIHGSAFWCGKLMEVIENEQPDRILLLGDLLYHGPRNALPELYDTSAVAKFLNDRKNMLLCVRGNCDTEVDQMVLKFPILSDTACLFADGHAYIAAQGHHDVPPLREGDILLGGHTHVPAFELRKNHAGTAYRYINPGSVSLPKESSPRSYVILDGNSVSFYDLDGKCYRQETIGG